MTKINELARMWNALGTNGIFNNVTKPVSSSPSSSPSQSKTQLLEKNSLKQGPKETIQVTEHVQGFAAAMLGIKEEKEEEDESNNGESSSEEEGSSKKKAGKR